MTVPHQGSQMLIIFIFLINIAYFQVKSKISASYLENYGFYAILRKMYNFASEKSRAFCWRPHFFRQKYFKMLKNCSIEAPKISNCRFFGPRNPKMTSELSYVKAMLVKIQNFDIFFLKNCTSSIGPKFFPKKWCCYSDMTMAFYFLES